MRKWFFTVILISAVAFIPFQAFSANESISVGYGFGLFNHSGGKLEDGKHYNFVQVAFSTEKALSKDKKFNLLLEPFAAYVIDPNSGADFGVNVAVRYYFGSKEYEGFYVTAGSGLAYTTIGFKEQGTHLLFTLHGGVGYKYKNFFIEDRFRHYSNAGLASPNKSVNANIVNIGYTF